MQNDTEDLMCYYINLDRSVDRRAHMETVIKDRGLTAIRIAACDGATLTDAACAAHRPPASGKRQLSKPEIGCFLSHRAAWTDIAAGDQRWGCVFEDDIMLSQDISHVLRDIYRSADHTTFVKLESFLPQRILIGRQQRSLCDNRVLAPVHSTSDGTAGYLLSRENAVRLLDASQTCDTPVDDFMFNPAHWPLADVIRHHVVPGVCIQQKQAEAMQFLPADAGQSIIDEARLASQTQAAPPRRRGWRKLRREVMRPFDRPVAGVRNRLIAWRANGTWTDATFRM
ncbi:glycosyltransferase family 25 protein [Yoonia sp.]|uniref:glycosyltransferase family 25 protein n=1 Tax=Yoonia sp. TaxID=2212373 RepID=UPI0025CC547C|nr:glycosyltransferase family 25 protein [Yoonia sp.]